MKKNKTIHLIILFILFLGMIFNPITISADSGFDSSYDSGGSSYDSDSGDGGGGSIHVLLAFVIVAIFEAINKKIKNNIVSGIITFPICIFLLLLMFGVIHTIITIIFTIFMLGGEKKVKNKINISNDISHYLNEEEIKNLDPNLNIEEFRATAFNIYKDVQEAWMNFDLDKIKNLVSDELYNMYSMQLDTLKIMGQKNIMSDITTNGVHIKNITFENNIETIETIMIIKCYDYIVDNNEKVIRGNKNIMNIYAYKITFAKHTDNKTLKYCPNCGAPIDINSTGKCEYCASTIINNEAKWIMTKKQMLSQRRTK